LIVLTKTHACRYDTRTIYCLTCLARLRNTSNSISYVLGVELIGNVVNIIFRHLSKCLTYTFVIMVVGPKTTWRTTLEKELGWDKLERNKARSH